MSIGEICNRDVVIVTKHDNVIDLVKLMRKHHVGDVVVVEDEGEGPIPVGIVTDRDILIRIIGEDLSMDDVGVEDLMSYDLLTANEQDSLTDALKLMRGRGVRRLVVVDDKGQLIGILTVDDIIDLLAEEISELAKLTRNEILREARQTSHTAD